MFYLIYPGHGSSVNLMHIEVDKETSKLLTFAAPFGRYHVKKLPVYSANEMFLLQIAYLIAGIEGTVDSKSSIIMSGISGVEHYNKFFRSFLKEG